MIKIKVQLLQKYQHFDDMTWQIMPCSGLDCMDGMDWIGWDGSQGAAAIIHITGWFFNCPPPPKKKEKKKEVKVCKTQVRCIYVDVDSPRYT